MLSSPCFSSAHRPRDGGGPRRRGRQRPGRDAATRGDRPADDELPPAAPLAGERRARAGEGAGRRERQDAVHDHDAPEKGAQGLRLLRYVDPPAQVRVSHSVVSRSVSHHIRTRIERVEPGMAADQAGMKVGDYIVFVGNHNVVKMDEDQVLKHVQ